MVYTVTAEAARAAPLDFRAVEPVERVLQGVRLALTTPKGSVPMYREYGLDMSVLDRPAPIAQALLTATVRETVERWVPEATVKGVTFGGAFSRGQMQIRVEVEIHGTSA